MTQVFGDEVNVSGRRPASFWCVCWKVVCPRLLLTAILLSRAWIPSVQMSWSCYTELPLQAAVLICLIGWWIIMHLLVLISSGAKNVQIYDRFTTRESHCLYHNDPDGFKSALKNIKKALKIPSHFCKRVPMCVCSCRTRASHRIPLADLKTENDAADDNAIFSALGDVNEQTMKLVKRAFRLCSQECEDSALMFVCLLRMAKQGNFTLLETELNADLSKQHTDKMKRKKEKKPFFLKGYLNELKKKYSLKPREFTVSMHPINMPFLQTDTDIGEHFKIIKKRYRPCVIEHRGVINNDPKNHNIYKTIFKVWCKEDVYEHIKDTIVISATYVYNLKKEEFKVIQDCYRARKVEIMWNLFRKSENDCFNPLDAKEAKLEDFDKKKLASLKKENKDNRKKTMRCIKCLVTAKKKEAKDSEIVCVYHPGFIERQRWSCCHLSVAGTDHSCTSSYSIGTHALGCSRGPHAWRAVTLANQKVRGRKCARTRRRSKMIDCNEMSFNKQICDDFKL